jgi:hypothetical protein
LELSDGFADSDGIEDPTKQTVVTLATEHLSVSQPAVPAEQPPAQEAH